MWLPPPLPRTFEACLRDLASAKPEIRASAASDLVRHGRGDTALRAQAVPLLEKALGDEVARVRASAAVALADLEAKEAVEPLLRAVEDDDAEVRQMAMAALGEIGDARAARRLEKAQSDTRPEMRYQAVIALSHLLEGEELCTVLQRGTSDDDFNVRYIALRLAEERASEPAPPRLVTRAARLLDDEAPDVAIAAAIYLAKAGDERGKPRLLRVVEGTEKAQAEDEREAVELAGRIGLTKAIPALERRAFGVFRLVRDTCSFHALIALARLGHGRAIDDITRDLDARSKKKREAAVVAAGRAGLTVAKERIERMQDSDVSADLRAEALRALAASPAKEPR